MLWSQLHGWRIDAQNNAITMRKLHLIKFFRAVNGEQQQQRKKNQKKIV